MKKPVPVPFHRPSIGEEEIAAVADVLRSGWLTTGPQTQAFETAFAAYVGARHAVAVSSGTAALHVAMVAAGLGPGDGILTTPLTFPATTEAAIYCGARPWFVDVDPLTQNLDPAAAEVFLEREAERQRIRVLVPVHYGGRPCALEALLPLARRFGLLVIEDAAHALPAWRRMPGEPGSAAADATHLPPPPAGEAWRCVGSIGDFTAFSFYATKPITTGEGGMVTTSSDSAVELLRSLRLHGLSADAWKRHRSEGSWRYDVARTGFKYNLPDVLAALGVVQLRRADALAAERRRLAMRYREALAPLHEDLDVPEEDDRSGHAWHLFPVRLRRPGLRDLVIEGMRSREIGVGVHFLSVHLHSFYRRTYGHRPGEFPFAEEISASVISLPFYPGLTDLQIETVVAGLAAALREAAA